MSCNCGKHCDKDEEIKFEVISKYNIKDVELPKRATKDSVGYDFKLPMNITYRIKPKEIEYVKTGVKAKFPTDTALLLLNRSSNPKKKGLVLVNGLGLVESDYYNNTDNEGEIAFAFMNITDEEVIINPGDKLGQGMFIPWFKTTDDVESSDVRTGGFGSTNMEDK